MIETKKTLPHPRPFLWLPHGIKQKVPIKFRKMEKTASRSQGLRLFAGQEHAGDFLGDGAALCFAMCRLM